MAATVSLVRIQDQLDFSGTPGAGTDGYALTWDDATSRFVLEAVAATPAGSSGQVQYNAAGAFGGAAGLAWSTSSPNLTVTAQGAAHVPLVLQLAASQTANALNILADGSATPLLYITKDGVLGSNRATAARTYLQFQDSGAGVTAIYKVEDLGAYECAVSVGWSQGYLQSGSGAGSVTMRTAGYNSTGFRVNGQLKIENVSTTLGYGSATDYPFDSNRGSHRIIGGSSTYATWYANRFGQVTLSGHSATQTVTDAATLRVDGDVIAGSSAAVTITNNWSLWVAGGTSRFDGAIRPASLADSAAPNGTIYYSTDASKLVFKDSGGVVNNLY